MLATEDLEGVWVGQKNGKLLLWHPKSSESILGGSGGSASLIDPKAKLAKQASSLVHKGSSVAFPSVGGASSVGSVSAHSGPITAMCFHQGRIWTASGSSDKTVKLWQPIRGSQAGKIAVMVQSFDQTENDSVLSIGSADAHMLVGTKSGYIRAYDFDKLKWKPERRPRDGDKNPISAILHVVQHGQVWLGGEKKIYRTTTKVCCLHAVYHTSPL
jgi:WD40 repeat protein